MKISVFIASLLFVGALFFVSFASAEENSLVTDLTPENFDEHVGKSSPAFVEFYAPWCGHCKSLAPEYEIVAKSFGQYKKLVTVAKVNCDAHKDLCSRFEVRGYPTLKWFEADSLESEAYSGARDAKGIVDFINGKTHLNAVVSKPPEPVSHVTVLTDANFDGIVMDKSKGVFVEFYAPWCGHCKRLAPDWDKLSYIFSSEPNVVIAKMDATENPDSPKRYGVTGYPTLFYFPPEGKESPLPYDGDRSLEALVKYVNKQARTDRLTDGRLSGKAGRIPQVDKLISTLISSENQQAIIDEVKSVVATLTDKPTAQLYLKLAEKVLKSGRSYVDTEIARLNKMLDFGALVPKKKDEFGLRVNLLRSFIEPYTEEKEEEPEEEKEDDEDDQDDE